MYTSFVQLFVNENINITKQKKSLDQSYYICSIIVYAKYYNFFYKRVSSKYIDISFSNKKFLRVKKINTSTAILNSKKKNKMNKINSFDL